MTDKTPDSTLTVLITGDGMGRADTALSHKLIQTYLSLLDLEDRLPGIICFYTEGVRLVIEASPVLGELQALQDKGVRLIVCGSCVNFYNVAHEVRVGEVGSMQDVIAAQWQAEKVITI